MLVMGMDVRLCIMRLLRAMGMRLLCCLRLGLRRIRRIIMALWRWILLLMLR
jgi:hypothetical protein